MRSGDIGPFKFVTETGVAAGVRRIEAVTGAGALDLLAEADGRIEKLAGLMKSEPSTLTEKLEQLLGRSRELEKELEAMKGRLASEKGQELSSGAQEIGGLKVLAARVDGVDQRSLRETVDQLKNKLGSGVVVLATVADGKVSLVAGVTADGVKRIQAGPLVNFVAQQVGGKGGGRPDMAQAGGNDPAKLDQALDGVTDWVREQLEN